MTIAYASLHRTLRYRGEDTKLYCAAFEDGTMFFSRQQPPLFDAAALRIAMREVVPGSYVNLRSHVERSVNMLDAVQLVRQPVEKAPFSPVPDDAPL
jgi:hypothetical protein